MNNAILQIKNQFIDTMLWVDFDDKELEISKELETWIIKASTALYEMLTSGALSEYDGTECDDNEQLGHDLYLTIQGHGSGFWDGDYPETGSTLTEWAESAFSELNLYESDGFVFCMGLE